MTDMNMNKDLETGLPDDLKQCIAFHGHFCPGLAYGYLVARGAQKYLGLSRSSDEEVVAICENDSCSVDALQTLLGTTFGKGNLVFRDYGKNAFTIFSRNTGKAYRFSRKTDYVYEGENLEEYNALASGFSDGSLSPEQNARYRYLKGKDLALKPCEKVFDVREIEFERPPYAPLAPSTACAVCGELTMQTKMVKTGSGDFLCKPCAEQKDR